MDLIIEMLHTAEPIITTLLVSFGSIATAGLIVTWKDYRYDRKLRIFIKENARINRNLLKKWR